MPNRDTPPLTRAVVLRGIGFALAIVLGGAAVWLIVTSTTQKRIEIGVLTGLWGLLLGAYSMFGSRRAMHYSEELVDTPQPGGALEVRATPTALERAEAAAERRDFQAGLEQLLHREIRSAVSLEVGELRSEIAALRSELLEKVGGQIRLERIETTRVIGSDLEALQQEVRQLKAVREATMPAPAASIVNLAVSAGPADPMITRLFPAAAPRLAEPAPAFVEPAESEPVVEPAATIPAIRAEPETREAPPAAPEPVVPPPAPAVTPAAEPRAPQDPFAGLPRIRPFTEFVLDPIEPLAAPEPVGAAPAPATNGSTVRHGTPDEQATPPRASGPAIPRRNRRADESNAGQELLAKLLAREGS